MDLDFLGVLFFLGLGNQETQGFNTKGVLFTSFLDFPLESFQVSTKPFNNQNLNKGFSNCEHCLFVS